MSGTVTVRGMLSGDWGRPLREVTLEQRVDQNSALEDAATGRASEAPGRVWKVLQVHRLRAGRDPEVCDH